MLIAAVPSSASSSGAMPIPALFDCVALRARLTVSSCAARWCKAADRLPEPWDSLSRCRNCPIGARHAGIEFNAVEAAADAWRLVCCRCLRPSERLIRGKHCISCYNRDREARIGKNAKGGRPHLTDHLGTCAVAVAAGGAVELITAHRVTGPVEVMVCAARTAKAGVTFGRPGRTWALPIDSAASTPDKD
ncbi:hypothetical protein KPL78_04175 [Roseomonas sp. HJA6]|uniref:Uncharacterized protein n=1 Tax=Roseomonas alba TaxID=2846776 RepID=A0ABS7A418_9PROT|nr:hypothetical protein [Neoroseomonas alba]MBW6397029.1 hypothetical protein [Neoroseomonas alba]